MLGCAVGQVSHTDSLRYLETQTPVQFDLVFLDPPFHQNLLPAACALLEERQWLAESAWIYTESEISPSSVGLPGNWRLHREKKAGQVYYALWQRSAEVTA
jgi:16S rRNA (guanine966-N2)-methyltransferase